MSYNDAMRLIERLGQARFCPVYRLVFGKAAELERLVAIADDMIFSLEDQTGWVNCRAGDLEERELKRLIAVLREGCPEAWLNAAEPQALEEIEGGQL